MPLGACTEALARAIGALPPGDVYSIGIGAVLVLVSNLTLLVLGIGTGILHGGTRRNFHGGTRRHFSVLLHGGTLRNFHGGRDLRQLA